MAFIDWLHQGRLPREVAGGKGAALSDLVAAGFLVPTGFCINAEGYHYFVESTGLDASIGALVSRADLGDAEAVRSIAPSISALVNAAEMPGELRNQIAAAYDELATLAGPACAVRSSAISEDSSASSFAGLYETSLNVRGAASVLDSVRRCYASAWSERALRYRATQGSGFHDEAMAVVVMGLVPSEVSGVAFTAHPVTGDRSVVVINAAFGLGEAIVSGTVTPDSFVISKDDWQIRERDINEKELAVYPHPDDAGTIERPLDATRAVAPSLTNEEACEVARLATRVEAHYGRPQDVEWGIAGGQLFLLQSRPITTL